METKIETLHFTLTEGLDNYIREKVEKLEKMYDRIDTCHVILKLENKDTKKNKLAEIVLIVPGGRLFAHALDDTFELSVVETVKELERQIEKHKSKFGKEKVKIEDAEEQDQGF